MSISNSLVWVGKLKAFWLYIFPSSWDSQNFVRQFFAEDELMIGRAFWNFILKSENGGEIVEQSFAFYAEKTHNYLIELRRMHGLS